MLRSIVQISVSDVNEHKPVFQQQTYVIDVKGKLFADQILLQLNATDDDCTELYSNICAYDIFQDDRDIFNITQYGTYKYWLP